MNRRTAVTALFTLLFTLCSAPMATAQAQTERYKVLVVMSYEEDNPWCQEIREGIEGVLAEVADIDYLYMDTKVDPAGGGRKAAEALQRYKASAPDGVITADDNAQRLFVEPHLKNQVDTPVMFCGVNADPAKYGFPADNVSGVLERGHVRESIAFVRQFSPQVQRVGFVVRNSPSGRALREQVQAEQSEYRADVSGFHLIDSIEQLQGMGEELQANHDVLYVDSLEGMPASGGKALSNRDVLMVLSELFPKPILAGNQYQVEQGAMSAVVKTGQEQGEGAARQLLAAMRGTPVEDIPISRNFRGRRVINVSTLERLKITPRPIVLRGATLVRTAQ